MTRLTSSFLLLLLCFFVGTASAKEKEVVHLSTLNWHPYIGEQLPNQGIAAKIVKQAFLSQGIEVQINFFPWARALSLAKKGVVHGLMPEYFDKSREKDFIYSSPFLEGPVSLCKRKGDSFDFNGDFKTLHKKDIGVVRGYINTPQLDNDSNINKIPSRDDKSNLKMLNKGRVDLIFIDQNVLNYLSKQNESCKFLMPPIETKKLYIAFSKNNPNSKKFIKAFNKGLKFIEKEIPLLINQYLDK